MMKLKRGQGKKKMKEDVRKKEKIGTIVVTSTALQETLVLGLKELYTMLYKIKKK